LPLRERQCRQSILANLLERAGQPPAAVFDLIGDVLINRDWGLMITGNALGETLETDDDGEEIGLELAARLERIRRFLTAILGWGARTVWFAFTTASLPSGYVRVGPVQFFDARIVGALRHGEQPLEVAIDELPLEIEQLARREEMEEEDDDWGDPFESLPEEGFVLARVVVRDGWPDRSQEFVRRLVGCAVSLAYPASGWRMMAGSVSFEGEIPLYSDLAKTDLLEHRPVGRDATAEGLEVVPAVVFERLVAGTPAAVELERGAAWVAAVARLPNAAQRVALGLRALEEALPPDPTSDGWGTGPSVRRFLFTPWRDGSMIAHTRWVLEAAVVDAGLEGPGEWTELLRRVPVGDPHLLEFANDVVPRLAMRLPDSAAVRVHCDLLIERLGPGREKWAADLLAIFDTLLGRAVRLRNAVLHGGAVQATVVESVDGFVARLTGYVNEYRTLSPAQGADMLDLLERVRVTSWLGGPLPPRPPDGNASSPDGR
jgi:hypothetical protein